MKVRVLNKNGYYYVQRSFLFFFWKIATRSYYQDFLPKLKCTQVLKFIYKDEALGNAVTFSKSKKLTKSDITVIYSTN